MNPVPVRPFRNRADAGQRLAAALGRHRRDGSVVLGIPRGGVAIGVAVAEGLEAVFSVLVVLKLPFPGRPGDSFGAVAEDGTVHLLPGPPEPPPPEAVERLVREQEAEVLRRVRLFRPERTIPDLRNKSVILVDDGLQRGSTALAGVACCRNRGASRVTVAAPVAAPAALEALRRAADAVEVLQTPGPFGLVSDFYHDKAELAEADLVRLVAGIRRGTAAPRWPGG